MTITNQTDKETTLVIDDKEHIINNDIISNNSLDMIENQVKLEEKYNLYWIQEQYKAQWNKALALLNPLYDRIVETFPNKTVEEICDDFIQVLYLLDELGHSYISTLLEILMSKNELDSSINYWKSILNFGAICKLWKYRQIYKNGNKLTVIVQKKFTSCNEYQEAKLIAMYRLPMLIEPKMNFELNKDSYFAGYSGKMNRGSGYLKHTFDVVILGEIFHNEEICLETLSRQNKIKFKLNKSLFDLFEYSLDFKDIQDKLENKSKQSNFHKINLNNILNQVEHNLAQYKEQIKMSINELINHDYFYLTHKVDLRGRTYCQGYQINYQGNGFNKACIELANTEIINNVDCLNGDKQFIDLLEHFNLELYECENIFNSEIESD